MPFDHFGKIAGFYNHAAKFSLKEPLQGWLNLHKENTVLDAGGGTGRVSEEIQLHVKRVVVADISLGMLRYSIKKDLPCVCSPAECLPFPPDSFDRVIMMDAFHHVQNQSATAAELWRILRPGGKILIIEPDIDKLSVKCIALGEKLLLMRSHFLPAEWISTLFAYGASRREVIRFENNALVIVEKPGIDPSGNPIMVPVISSDRG